MTDERLRDLYARGLRARAARGAGAPLPEVSPDELLALAEGTLPEERRLELFDVVMASEPLRREFALVRAAVVAARQSGPPASEPASGDDEDDEDRGATTRAVDDEAPDVIPLPVRPSGPVATHDAAAGAEVIPLRPRRTAGPSDAGPWWRRLAGPLAIAASLLLVILVGRDLMPRPEDAGVMRGAENDIGVVAPAAEAAPAEARRFVWHPVPEAVRYAFELVDPDGTLVYQTTTADTALTLPAAVTLRPAVEYRWLVRATDAAATTRATAVRRLQVSAP